jgi:DNA replication protein DnaC
MKQISELMAKSEWTPAPQDSFVNPSELIATLTPEEREYHLKYAIERMRENYAFRLAAKGASPEQIAHKMATRDWTISAEDQESILVAAAYRKRWAEENERDAELKKRAAQERVNQLRATWTAEFLLCRIENHYIAKHGQFKHVAGQDKYFRALAYMLSDDARLETELGMDPLKGLLVLGESGTGKTETLKAVRTNPLAPVRIVSILEIAEHVREHGSCELQIRADHVIVLDDVGAETVPVKYFGTEINWFKEFIEMTYLRGGLFSKLIVTTNLGGKQIEDLYGYRVRSRIREMFNVINLDGEDLRK